MSLTSRAPRSLIASSSRSASTSAPSASASTGTTIRAAVLLSRQPLLTPTPTPLESTYHTYQSHLRSALSNPSPSSFYFKPGSLPLRRFQAAEHASDLAAFGPRLAGKTPDVGDLPAEAPVEEMDRGYWADKDAEKGEASLERRPEEEVYCLIGEKGGWSFPSVDVNVGRGEGVDQAVKRGLLGKEGEMGGEGMDSWIVSRKPVGVVKNGNERTFFIRAHILAGAPTSPSTSTQYAWLSADEVAQRVGQDTWAAVRGMFGVSAGVEAEAERD